MIVILNTVLSFPAAPLEWWRDGTVVAGLCARLRTAGLWFDYHYAGVDGTELKRLTGDQRLGRWSARWKVRGGYRLAAAPAAGDDGIKLTPSNGLGLGPATLRVYMRLGDELVAQHRAALLDRWIGWLLAVHESGLGGGVHIRRSDVTLDEPRSEMLRWPFTRAWETGSLVDVIDRDVYADVVASNYFNGEYGTVEEGELELAAVLAAPTPATTVRRDVGRLVIWKHVPDLTDDDAVERARIAQRDWIVSLVVTHRGD